MTNILLIRHAQSGGNTSGIFQGQIDSLLTPTGEKQLKSLSEKMKELPFEAIYSSPLKRAAETAKAANKYYNLPTAYVSELMELNGGEWEGKLFADIPVLYPELAKVWEDEPHNFAVTNGESMQQLCDRMASSIGKIAADNDGKTVCVVSHGCAIRNYICYVRYGTLKKLPYVEWCDNTAIYKIEYNNGKPTIISGADSSHLKNEDSTFKHQDWWKKVKKEEEL